MDMTSRVPDWLTPFAWTYIALCLASAAYLTWAAVVRSDPGRVVHPATALMWIASALYLGPAAVLLFHRHGRPAGSAVGAGEGAGEAPESPERPTALGGLPGGGASALAHLVGVPLVVASGITIAGIDLWVMILTIGVLAIALLYAYERAMTSTARDRTAPTAVPTAVPAVVAAVVTVLAFDIGMGGWMLLLHYNAFMPPASEGSFWFLMQVGILLGLVTAYPAVSWLTRRGSYAVAT